jgi:lysophospholipase L1-like esterase
MRASLRFSCLALASAAIAWAGCSGDPSQTTPPGGQTGSGGAGTSSGTAGGGATSSGSSMSGGGGDGGAAGSGAAGGSGGAGGGGPITAAECFADDFVNPQMDGPDYDQFGPVIGSHCMGTNHQDIAGVERVVFLGDSITVGTPPTLSGGYYRSLVADALAAKFGIQAPNGLWKAADFINGTSLLQESGDFASCSKWGARTDDLLMGGAQIADCFAPEALSKRTLVVMTMGGNDIASLTQDAIDGATQADLWMKTQEFVQYQREAMEWLYAPGRFPNGVLVVFANIYEFTDGTGDVQACDVSGLAGFDQPVPAPDQLKEMVIWANEQYLSIAVDHQADMIFLLEDFCGHGFNAEDPTAPCYRGPGNANWFDLTCIHPNPTGHQHIADMFMAVVNE